MIRSIFSTAGWLGAAGVTYYIGRNDGPAPYGMSEVWYIGTALAVLAAINVATPVRIIRAITSVLAKVTVTFAYGYLAVKIDLWPLYIIAGVAIGYLAADLWGLRPGRIFDLLFSRFSLPPMPEDDARFWAGCNTIEDLGRVGALYLEGRIGSQPAYAPGCGVDPETSQLVPALVAANRAGFYTHGSQPGNHDGFQQHAYVTGFAGLADMMGLELLLSASELHYRIRRADRRRDRVNVGQITWGMDSADNVAGFYGEVCSEQAVKALLGGWQIVIHDPEAGRDDRVWPLLTAFAAERQASVDPMVKE